MAADLDWKQQIRELLSVPGNNECADCGKSGPDWGVFNIGVFVCIDCAGVHRQMGTDISKVRSTQYDTWTESQLTEVAAGGNIAVNQTFERRKPNYYLGPRECPQFNAVREQFIRTKYEQRSWTGEDQKDREDPALHFMPQKAIATSFLMESGKKRVYIQLLGKFLYHFRSAHDSYSFEHFDVRNLECHLVPNNNDDPILMITQGGETLFRLRETNILDLIEWIHAIRRSTCFYRSPLAQQILPRPQQSQPIEFFEPEHLQQCTDLGMASKKGGARHGWKPRWWCYHDGFLYYFKANPANARKKKDTKPKGEIPLFGADVIIDHNRHRTGKANAVMICTHKRTFYILPNAQTKDHFFGEVDRICSYLWNRQQVDFRQLDY